jgi:hypothetical protein
MGSLGTPCQPSVRRQKRTSPERRNGNVAIARKLAAFLAATAFSAGTRFAVPKTHSDKTAAHKARRRDVRLASVKAGALLSPEHQDAVSALSALLISLDAAGVSPIITAEPTLPTVNPGAADPADTRRAA